MIYTKLYYSTFWLAIYITIKEHLWNHTWKKKQDLLYLSHSEYVTSFMFQIHAFP